MKTSPFASTVFQCLALMVLAASFACTHTPPLDDGVSALAETSKPSDATSIMSGSSVHQPAIDDLHIFVLTSDGCGFSRKFSHHLSEFLEREDVGEELRERLHVSNDISVLPFELQEPLHQSGVPAIYVFERGRLIDMHVGFIENEETGSVLDDFMPLMHRYGLLDASFANVVDRTLPSEEELRELGGVQYMVLDSPSMEGMDLSGLDLRRNNFRGASFQGADLRGTNLKGTTLSYANFEDALIDEDTNVKGAFWHETICPDGTISDERGCFNHTPSPKPATETVESQPPPTSPNDPYCRLHGIVNTLRGPQKLNIETHRIDAQWAFTTILSIYETVDERQPQLPAALSREDAFSVLIDARDTSEGWVSIFVLFPEEIAAEYFTGPGTSFRIPPSLAEEIATSAFENGSAELISPTLDDCYREAD